MAGTPGIDLDLLRPYFKTRYFEDDTYRVEIELFSSPGGVAFELSMECKEPGYCGAYPQRRYSLERHSDAGHEGVHIQINYHRVGNETRLGRLYILLDIRDDKELLDVAEGFVVLLHEILRGIDRGNLAEQLFHTARLDRLYSKKEVLMDRVMDSIRKRRITIRSDTGSEELAMTQGQIEEIQRTRKELRPLFGPLIDKKGL